jgi:hypothetical protein
MTFSIGTMGRESMPHDINNQQSFKATPLILDGQKKHGCTRPYFFVTPIYGKIAKYHHTTGKDFNKHAPF